MSINNITFNTRIDLIFESISPAKVGKKASAMDYYVHVDAISKGESNINPTQLDLFNTGLDIITSKFPSFVYDFVNINSDKRNPKVRFLKMSSLEDAHPIVVDAKVVELATGVVTDGRLGEQIYHRLDTIVSPSHKTYKFHKAVAEYEVEEKKLLGQKDTPSFKIGHLKHWKLHIDDKYNYIDFEKDISILKSNFL
jgi:hypothetical protein